MEPPNLPIQLPQQHHITTNQNHCHQQIQKPSEVSAVIDGSDDKGMLGAYNGVSVSGKTNFLGLSRDDSFKVYYRDADTGTFDLRNKNVRNTTEDINSIKDQSVDNVI